VIVLVVAAVVAFVWHWLRRRRRLREEPAGQDFSA